MSKLVIKADNISKRYMLGTIGSGSLRRDMQNWWSSSFLNNDKTDIDNPLGKTDSKDQIWALKDINLEIKEGETWGIVGSNGAGKSTFLKILSRIIKPTSGSIKGRGRISSLLEVGTGFHSELTGRENIFISGHILGMKKAEIQQKFDEIVEFSGVENFLDTPVKRYSSGMYVRLAFAVAAHLEPDILIIDEVLAVGDAEFQKKCLGKMNDASTQKGRTIIFVSHNLQAVSNLCSNAIWLDKGSMRESGPSKTVINSYLNATFSKKWKHEVTDIKLAPGNENIRVTYIELIPHLANPYDVIDIRTPLTIKFRFYNANDNICLSTDLLLFTSMGDCIFDVPSKPTIYNRGFVEGECTIPGNFLNDGSFYFTLHFSKDTSIELFSFDNCLMFDIADYRENSNWYDKWWGYVRPNFPLLLNPVGENNLLK
ncbi:ABC transporter ATP-binding protein [Algoriphagus chordae]|uniref:Lipopolysaccharide transport system ATP-binding protein n=1 Tax=Algoriphagus chordae TaxID=237019 RepID=A0A2W7QTN4_9BACT|nr:ABC transporter ATP-binding protein [Algoriphagus chordae]PZX50516.1 lipopolysaccharide transport system ATP-binding protein [Algoriphagus chordae]